MVNDLYLYPTSDRLHVVLLYHSEILTQTFFSFVTMAF